MAWLPGSSSMPWKRHRFPPRFEAFFGCVIISNSVFLGIQVQVSSLSPGTGILKLSKSWTSWNMLVLSLQAWVLLTTLWFVETLQGKMVNLGTCHFFFIYQQYGIMYRYWSISCFHGPKTPWLACKNHQVPSRTRQFLWSLPFTRFSSPWIFGGNSER